MATEAGFLLIEIGTEELPPKALPALSAAFSREVISGFQKYGVELEQWQDFATPRRLAILIAKLPARAPDKVENKLGPNIKAAYNEDGSPSKAALGFARSCGVDFAALATVDTDKGERLAYKIEETGQRCTELLEPILRNALSALPIPKKMRWGELREEFIRPVQWLLLMHDSTPIPLSLFDIASGSSTRGHRFHANREISLAHASDYAQVLEQEGHVVADYDQRKTIIREQLLACGSNIGGKVVIDEALLDEVCSLVEWPQALAGSFDERFLSLPKEALVSSMRSHQKYFHVEADNGELLPSFITVANIRSTEPAEVIRGNERVIRPRLADAEFFYRSDAALDLSDLSARLDNIVFHKKLGSVGDKSRRLAELAVFIAKQAGEGAGKLSKELQEAAKLCKADLVTDMVGEFADLQGTMGRYYAEQQGIGKNVALAIEQHYLPRFAGDTLPEDGCATFLALADRLDTLVGIFSVNETPSGSKDPYALRRASLAVLRICIENGLALDLRPCLDKALSLFDKPADTALTEQVLEYIMERLRAWYTEKSIPVENFLAVHSCKLGSPSDIDARVLAVTAFAELPEAETLAAANKRVANILAKATEKFPDQVSKQLLAEAAEKDLALVLEQQNDQLQPLLKTGQYSEAMRNLAALKQPVDEFFDSVMVMDDNPELRNNRLALLASLRAMFSQIADISLLASK